MKSCEVRKVSLILTVMKQNEVYIIVVAGGTGSRFGASCPKQYCLLGDRPVLCHTLERLHSACPQAHIITVVSDSMMDYWRELVATHNLAVPHSVVAGGSTRWASVKNALDSITDAASADAVVLVHDGARPLVDAATVDGVLDAIAHGVSAVPVYPVTDSLRLVAPDGSSKAVERSAYRAVTTPQGFMLSDLREAYRLPFSPSFTDDASVMEAAGMTRSVLVDSTPTNIKITNPGDIALAQWYLDNE